MASTDMYYTDIRTWAIFLLSFILVYIYMNSRPKAGRLPPGPLGLPILGSIPFLGNDPREPLRQLAQKYGDVFTVYLGPNPAVVLNSYTAIKEALVQNAQAFTGRPQYFFLAKLTGGKGILTSDGGESWRTQRKFAHSILRDFGVGRGLIEERIHEEIHEMMNNLECHPGPLDMTHLLQTTVANIICSIVLGHRYDPEDKVFIKLLQIMDDLVENVGNAGALTAFPILKYIPGDLFAYKKTYADYDFMKSVFHTIVQDHIVTYDPQITRDFIDAYLEQLEKEKSTESKSTFNDEELIAVLFDMFIAGSETTSSTLRWMIIFMLHNPDVQFKVQQEIDAVVGRHHLPKMQDRSQMPYTEATLLEIQRMADILPLGGPRCVVSENVQYRGYVLPKGTTILTNLNAINRDPSLWKDPFKFSPSHFQTPDGELDKKGDTFIPFSMGKRVCLGESLARTELFLLFTAIMQRFTLQLPDGHPLPPLTGRPGLTSPPYDCEVVLTARS